MLEFKGKHNIIKMILTQSWTLHIIIQTYEQYMLPGRIVA